MIEGVRKTAKWRHILEPDDAAGCRVDRGEKDPPFREGSNEVALHLDRKCGVHRGIAARAMIIEDRRDLFILNAITNL
jgi:hypothetical protein